MEQNVLIKDLKISLTDDPNVLTFGLSVEDKLGITTMFGATVNPFTIGYVIESLMTVLQVISTEQIRNIPARLVTKNGEEWTIKHFLHDTEFNIEQTTQKAITSIMYYSNAISDNQSGSDGRDTVSS